MSASGYDQVDRDSATGRSLEARVLLRCAMRLQECIDGTDLQKLFDAVSLNQKLWLLFYSEIEEKRVSLPSEVERNILSLATYVASRAPKAFSRDRETLQSLIDINRRIAAGLSVNAEDEPDTQEAPTGLQGVTSA